jgi:Tfp pilus assembly protein PilN
MSQQINLLDPTLRERRDWLSVPVISMIVLAILFVEVSVAAWQGWERKEQGARLDGLRLQLRQLQGDMQAVAAQIATRVNNPALISEIERANEALRQREEVLVVLEQRATGGDQNFSDYFMAFARQAMEGVWLTGFTINGRDLEIKGRMLDGAMLPVYIRRLEGEKNLHGRKFSALEMKHVEAENPAPGAAANRAAPERKGRPFVEFVLQGVGATNAQGAAR